ncbi:MAG TPA: LptA/OstA family protein [Chthoniobacterales bacterium]|nr:LptA/OstA family protein [Chthoniobacterales bacterium]
MRTRAGICALFLTAALGGTVYGQGSAPSTLSSRPPRSPAEVSPSPTPKAAKIPEEKPAATKESAAAATGPQQQIVTEIYADQAVFDSTKSIGVFSGHIVVTDPRFQIQGDKLTIYLGNKDTQGFDKAVVEGNVGVVRDRPNPTGPPDRMVGRAEKAVYTAKDGNFELTGNPRVQQGMNTHVATSPDTVMILNEKGQLQTSGPSRTEIRQAPKPETSPTP